MALKNKKLKTENLKKVSGGVLALAPKKLNDKDLKVEETDTANLNVLTSNNIVARRRPR